MKQIMSFAICAICATTLFAREINVSTASELLAATQNAVAGDTIWVAPGDYLGDMSQSGDPGNLPNGTGYFWIGNDGTADDPIVVVGSDTTNPPRLMGEAIDSGYVFHVTGDYVILKNLEITRGDKGVIYDNANYGIIEDCEIHNAGSELIHIRDGSSNCVISRNLIYDAGNGGNGSIGEGLYIGTDQARWGADDRPQSEWGDLAISEGYGGYDWRVTGTKVLYNYFSGSISAELMDIKEGTQNTTVEGNMLVGDSIGKKAGAQYYDDSFIDQKGVSGIFTNNKFFQGGNTITKYIAEVQRDFPHVPATLTPDAHATAGWCDESANDGNVGRAAENEVVTAPVDMRLQSKVEYFELFGNALGDKEIPAERLAPWERADITFPDNSWDTVNVATLGILPGNALSDSIALKLMAALGSKGTAKRVYYFPAGTYTFEQPIFIGSFGAVSGVVANDFVIAGDGPDKTKFLFDCDVPFSNGGLIWLQNSNGYDAQTSYREITTAPRQGGTTLALGYTWDVNVGDLLELKPAQAPDHMFPPVEDGLWHTRYEVYVAEYTEQEFAEYYGQIVRVEEKLASNTVRVHPPIGLDFVDSITPRTSIYGPDAQSQNIGIEGVYIEQVIDTGIGNGAGNIVFRYGKNLYVKNVESYNASHGHVIVEFAHNVLIADSKFGYAQNYEIDGSGVTIKGRSSIVTVENNIFEHLRHSVVLKEGANHCVIGYNYSHNWAILDPAVGVDAEADMSIHGMYSHTNLFEGNVCHNIYYADYWGPTGPRTTAFRNRTFGSDSREGIFVDDYSHLSNVMGNIVPRIGTDGTSDSLFFEGNEIAGSWEWNVLDPVTVFPNSLYLDGEPAFWHDTLVWPPFGPEVAGAASNRIPASVRAGEIVTTVGQVSQSFSKPVAIRVVNNQLRVNGLTAENAQLSLITPMGRVVASYDMSGVNSVKLPSLAHGVYLVRIQSVDGVVSKRLLVR